jgi:hypothetical protein
MNKIVCILIALILFSCQPDTEDKLDTTDRSATFQAFLKKFKTVELPFIFRYGNFEDSLEFDKMPAIDPNSNDTLYVKENDLNEIKCYGMLKDTSTFFSLIYFYPADNFYPVLVTYDKKGNLIDKVGLIVHGCGGDCGLEYCSETGIINKDLSIHCADTIVWKFSCDSLGEAIPNSDSVWVNSITGKLTHTGKLIMGKEVEQKYRDSIR